MLNNGETAKWIMAHHMDKYFKIILVNPCYADEEF